MSSWDLSVVLAAGGSGGHVEPALTLADDIVRQEPRARITVIGGDRGLETTLVPSRGYRLVQVPAVPMPRRVSAEVLHVPLRVQTATRTAAQALRSVKADVVVGFGGYAALPAYLAARQCRVPLVIHEANARAGLANRVGASLTSHVYATYPQALSGAIAMGLPLRPAITDLDRNAERASARDFFALPQDQPVLLVIGGSQGAQHINRVLALCLGALLDAGIAVLHAFGIANAAPLERPGYRPVPFIDRMDLAYAAADFAITRAGAMTCAELAVVGLPAAYVPLPIGNGEQRLNALPAVRAGAGFIVENQDLTSEWMLATVPNLLHDQRRLDQMSQAARSIGEPQSTAAFARLVLDIGREHRVSKHGAEA